MDTTFVDGEMAKMLGQSMKEMLSKSVHGFADREWRKIMHLRADSS